jgi:hypothetical protein
MLSKLLGAAQEPTVDCHRLTIEGNQTAGGFASLRLDFAHNKQDQSVDAYLSIPSFLHHFLFNMGGKIVVPEADANIAKCVKSFHLTPKDISDFWKIFQK